MDLGDGAQTLAGTILNIRIPNTEKIAPWWQVLSLRAFPQAIRLLPVMGLFLAITLFSLFLTFLALDIQSSMRSYVAGESVWSKAQKNAVYQLDLYAETHDSDHYRRFREFLAVPLGARKARLELEKSDFDYQVAFFGFLEAQNHPDDIPGMIFLFRYFSWVSYMDDAIEIWRAADMQIADLQRLATRLRAEIRSQQPSPEEVGRMRYELHTIDTNVSGLREAFTITLGQAARWVKTTLLLVVGVIVTVLLLLGLTIAWRTLKSISNAETQRAQAEQELRLAANALASIAEGVVIVDPAYRVISVNKAYTKITGYSADEAIGKTLSYPLAERNNAEQYATLWNTLNDQGFWQGEVWNQRKNGDIYPELLSVSAVHDDSGKVAYYVGVFNDISQYKEYEERLEHLARHDPLTDLFNRSAFVAACREALIRTRRRRRGLALLFVDLDGFKSINDSYGHAVGDQLLEIIAERMRESVRESDNIARLGGDEFAVLLEDLTDKQQAGVVAEKLLEALSQTITCNGHELAISASIGIAGYPEDGADEHTLLLKADAAMYEAKQSGRNTYRLHSQTLQTQPSD